MRATSTRESKKKKMQEDVSDKHQRMQENERDKQQSAEENERLIFRDISNATCML
jgi:hypothetical protein